MLRESRWLRRIAQCLLPLTLAATVWAKPKRSLTPLQKEAESHAAAAATALKSGDAETAVRELEAARDAAPNADILLELARALALRGEFRKSRDTLRELLATYDKTLGTKRAQVQAELTRVQAKLAELRLAVSEAGASVKLDDRDLGTSPLAGPVELDPGSHALAVSKPGFTPVTRQLDLHSGTTNLTIDLVHEVATGHLVVTATTTEPLELSIDDKPAGNLPLQTDLSPGFYKLAAASRTLRAAEQTVHVELGQTTNVTLVASPIPGEASVNAGDAKAAIYLDDRYVASGQWTGEVPAGKHQLRVERSGYEPYRQPLDVAPGERVAVNQIAYVALPAAKTGEAPAQYRGIFVDVALLGFFSSGATNSIAEDCAANATGGDCSSTAPAGGGLGVRIGYSFGWVALEGLLLGGADASVSDAKYEYGTSADLGAYYGVPREEHYVFVRYGYGFGAGARVMSRDSTFRVTGGLDFALMRRTARYVRATTANTVIPDAEHTNSDAESYFNPGLMADVGILLGSTPGLKFHTGLALLAEFPPDPVTTPGTTGHLGRYMSTTREPYGVPAVDLSRGPQVVVGPFLAMQFGH